MAAKEKKIDREYPITDSTVNCYGFRLLTSGYLIDEYKKNPIGYYMHCREEGVVVRWEDFRIDGDTVYAKPVINLSNERGQQTADEVDSKFLNGASVGHIVALEWSEDPSMMVPGQTGPTITKWFNRECSLVDIPGNFKSLALYDKEGTMINLADFKTQHSTTNNMKQIILTAAQLALIPNLKAEATSEEVTTALTALKAEADKVPQLTQDLAAANQAKTTAETAKKTAEDALAALKGQSVINLVDTAVKETRCTKEAGELLKKQYEGKPDELTALLATMKPYTPISTSLAAEGTEDEVKELMKLSGEQLFQKEGAFERLKEINLAGYKQKYKEYFGEEPPAESSAK